MCRLRKFLFVFELNSGAKLIGWFTIVIAMVQIIFAIIKIVAFNAAAKKAEFSMDFEVIELIKLIAVLIINIFNILAGGFLIYGAKLVSL